MARRGRRGRNASNQGSMPNDAPHALIPSSSPRGRNTPSASDAGSSASDAGSSAHDAGYFAQYGFKQNPDLTFIANFERLAITQGWSKMEKKSRRPEAFEAEFDLYVGTDVTKLEGWQRMCKNCLIEPAPPSIKQCKKALEKVHVNIYDYLDHHRDPELFRLHLFSSVTALRDYSVPDFIYPLRRAKEDTFLKALLRPFFFKRSRVV